MILLLQSDIRSMAEAFGVSSAEVRAHYCEVNDALSFAAGLPVHQLQATGGRCVFLDESNLCSIHGHKPFQCRYGPDRLMLHAMRSDYECMQGVEVQASADVTESFFNKLLSGE